MGRMSDLQIEVNEYVDDLKEGGYANSAIVNRVLNVYGSGAEAHAAKYILMNEGEENDHGN